MSVISCRRMADSSWLWGNREDADLMLILHTNPSPVSQRQLASTESVITDEDSASVRSVPPHKAAMRLMHPLHDHDREIDQDGGGLDFPREGPAQLMQEADHDQPVCMALLDLGSELLVRSKDKASGVSTVASRQVFLRQNNLDVPLQAASAKISPPWLAEEPTNVLLLHSTLVASASDYFRAKLTTSIGQRTASLLPSTKHKYEIHECVEEHLFLAAECVLEMMYKQEIIQPDISLLLGMLQISDRWIAPGCVSLCQSAWAVRKTSALTCKDLITIYTIPAALHSSPHFAPVMSCAIKSLLLLFGDVATVVASPSLTEQLLSLPYAAVLALVSNDKLTADCEDDVIMLLCWWLEGDMGVGCAGADLAELQNSIRYSQLSSTYLLKVIPVFPRLYPGEKQILQIFEYQEWMCKFPLQHTAEINLAQAYSIPLSWLKPARPAPASSQKSMSLHLKITAEELREHLAAAAGMAADGPRPASFSAWRVFRGLRTSVSVFSSSIERVLTAAIHVSIPLPHVHSSFELARGVPCSLGLDLHRAAHPGVPLKFEFPTGISQSIGVFAENVVFKMSQQQGNMLDYSWWQQFLVNGVLILTLRMTDKR